MAPLPPVASPIGVIPIAFRKFLSVVPAVLLAPPLAPAVAAAAAQLRRLLSGEQRRQQLCPALLHRERHLFWAQLQRQAVHSILLLEGYGAEGSRWGQGLEQR
jgi:hypothetical protein